MGDVSCLSELGTQPEVFFEKNISTGNLVNLGRNAFPQKAEFLFVLQEDPLAPVHGRKTENGKVVKQAPDPKQGAVLQAMLSD